ncbi:MAG: hypothetical protein MUP44_01180, partial [Anaerolineales bacterium]|nr:hypothetical protein [Anaerolineales bacterium]
MSVDLDLVEGGGVGGVRVIVDSGEFWGEVGYMGDRRELTFGKRALRRRGGLAEVMLICSHFPAAIQWSSIAVDVVCEDGGEIHPGVERIGAVLEMEIL